MIIKLSSVAVQGLLGNISTGSMSPGQPTLLYTTKLGSDGQPAVASFVLCGASGSVDGSAAGVASAGAVFEVTDELALTTWSSIASNFYTHAVDSITS